MHAFNVIRRSRHLTTVQQPEVVDFFQDRAPRLRNGDRVYISTGKHFGKTGRVLNVPALYKAEDCICVRLLYTQDRVVQVPAGYLQHMPDSPEPETRAA